MITFYHNINPVLLSFAGIDIYYYGVFYVIGFLFIWIFLKRLYNQNYFANTDVINIEDVDNIVLITAFYSFVSARLFYVIVYGFDYYIDHLVEIFMFWHGGMSVLGGIIGALLAFKRLSKDYDIDFFQLSDCFLLFMPLFLFLGRVANFINAELIGRVTTNFPLCIDYSRSEFVTGIIGCRYPSQLIEALKNLIIFSVLYYAYKKYYENLEYYEPLSKKYGKITFLFFILYSFLRVFVEFFRTPDYNMLFFGLSLNQILFSIVFVVALVFYTKFKQDL